MIRKACRKPSPFALSAEVETSCIDTQNSQKATYKQKMWTIPASNKLHHGRDRLTIGVGPMIVVIMLLQKTLAGYRDRLDLNEINTLCFQILPAWIIFCAQSNRPWSWPGQMLFGWFVLPLLSILVFPVVFQRFFKDISSGYGSHGYRYTPIEDHDAVDSSTSRSNN